ncbi:3'-phosphoadenosine 5'-phosphosulfate sulfotransferase [Candidatus Blochmanniella floridana]|uniref:Phosphoadenosine 5'-phosphosulfate reductase n=1 Tax=Blochmanniella floridana TaxID=203907 RepID=Q7VQH0_BLOFL|nr:3'-phosphoadenosine 5'-phosphosulfate sulfotransferase [Candidatus Blochmannia floridanus]
MNRCWCVEELDVLGVVERALILNEINQYLESVTIEDRIMWVMKYLSGQLVLSSSFGIHSYVSLHLMTNYYPSVPVILIDTGYLFPETYQFIDRLTEKMKLNLHVFRPDKSPAWQEARYGKLWEQGIEGIRQYNFMNKVKPMRYALKKLKVRVWVSGLRRYQSCSRKNLLILDMQNGMFKFLPIVDWDHNQVHQYIKRYDLEYHPLWKQGYVSVGDVHTTIKKEPGMKDEETRFFGLQRECGLHVID